MLKNNNYTDQYMCFTFNGINSSEKNVYIQNNTDDLKMYLNRGTNIEYTAPKYQNGRYVMGVTHSHREIPLKLVTEPMSRSDINGIMMWLTDGTIGDLSFDFASEWKYRVIVSSISDPILYATEGTSTFIATFDVKFHTIEGTDPINNKRLTITIDNINVNGEAIDKGSATCDVSYSDQTNSDKILRYESCEYSNYGLHCNFKFNKDANQSVIVIIKGFVTTGKNHTVLIYGSLFDGNKRTLVDYSNYPSDLTTITLNGRNKLILLNNMLAEQYQLLNNVSAKIEQNWELNMSYGIEYKEKECIVFGTNLDKIEIEIIYSQRYI